VGSLTNEGDADKLRSVFEFLKRGDSAEARARNEYAQLLSQLDASNLAKTNEIVHAIAEQSDETPLDPEETLRQHLAAFQVYSESALRDDELSGEEDRALSELRAALGLTYATLHAAGLDQLVDRIEIARINAGRLYEASSNLNTDEGEVVVWEDLASLVKPRRRFVGHSSGLSFRIARGVRFNTSWFEGAPVVDRTLVEDDYGPLSVTTKRVVFRGASRTIQIDYDDIVGMDLFLDALRFHVSNRERVDTFQVPGAPVAAAAINHLSQADPAEVRERLTSRY
jgi:hypothetical protein